MSALVRRPVRAHARSLHDPWQDVGFSPKSLSNLVAWYRSDLGITLNGSTVSSWADQSGNGHTVSQGTAASQPTYVTSSATYNGKPALQFGGTHSLVTSGFTQAEPNTIYVVGNESNVAAAGLFYDGTVTRQACGTNAANGNWILFAGAVQSDGLANNSPHAFAALFQNSTSGALYVDSSAAAAVTGNPSANSLNELDIGGPNAQLTGNVVELIIYNVIHTPQQVSALFKYFGARYGQPTWG